MGRGFSLIPSDCKEWTLLEFMVWLRFCCIAFNSIADIAAVIGGTTQHQQKWYDPSILDYCTRMDPSFKRFNQSNSSMLSNNQIKVLIEDGAVNELLQDCDPSAMLNNLSFLEQKIYQLQDLVCLIIGRKGQVLGRLDELVAQQQQLVIADLTSIIVQLISTAGSLLPSGKQTLSAGTPCLGQFAGFIFPSVQGLNDGFQPQNAGGTVVSELRIPVDISFKNGNEQNHIEEHESKDEDDEEEGESFYLARALAKLSKESDSEPAIKRYSCPYAGCKRNKDHKKFQPLKTVFMRQNHYKRTHCDKSYICSRCNTKKFSVIADLKTHEKHCGRDKWLCSCGTTFSRKDKLFGHIALFQGNTPAIPSEEAKAPSGPSDRADDNQAANKIGSMNYNFSSNVSSESEVQSSMDIKGSIDDPAGYFSPLNFDTCNFGGFHEFPRPPLDDSRVRLHFSFPGPVITVRKVEKTKAFII
ncbi:hypothetical protein F3Y22_tig00110007pilonHSYRG00147 [Hibiscus syriacus]|uniref:Protein SENSITIVE TO PROTON RHIZOTOXICITY 1 n=1 Tax=Hibiscus syriacus TaxID=106335 RepID=A0A6A3BNZ1_HIBSY|nr:hypothetical protein F3Y22_tig00110007pilonHSYRG00147 [Hibiscus syriacus]